MVKNSIVYLYYIPFLMTIVTCALLHNNETNNTVINNAPLQNLTSGPLIITTTSVPFIPNTNITFEIETGNSIFEKKMLRDDITTTEYFIPSITSFGNEVWCSMQPNGYYCDGSGNRRGHRPLKKEMYYYDTKTKSCKSFVSNGCKYNLNSFPSMKKCYSVCHESGRPPPDFPLELSCYLQPDFGFCDHYNPMWYFDVTRRRCMGFSYGGCAGNSNKYNDRKSCETICYEYIKYELGEPFQNPSLF